MNLSCPACGAALQLTNRASLLVYCFQCRASLVKTNQGFENFGTAAILPPDVSPVQIGSAGRYQGKSFVVVGRLKVAWVDGSWNEWCLAFDDGTNGWLAEAQGQWIILELKWEFNAKNPGDLRLFNQFKTALRSGSSIVVEGQELTSCDHKQPWYIGGEGELPFIKISKDKFETRDFRNPFGGFATIEGEGDDLRVFAGHIVPFADLVWQNLRELPGWNYQKIKESW